MKQTDYLGIVPAQYTGKEIEADASVELANDQQAKQFYAVAKQRLHDVNHWHGTVGLISAHFQVFDSDGQEVTRPVKQGDFLRVDILGPGGAAGDGYDWVTVEELKQLDEPNVQSFGFRVRPTSMPGAESDDIAHFYSEESTSTFMVSRLGRTVIACIVDRNTKANDDAHNLVDKIRNAPVAASAIGILSKAQWQGLANGVLRMED